MSKTTETYHDYVIKNGTFIGKFDEMYSKFEDPWAQSKQSSKYSWLVGAIHLRKLNIQSVLECGCGLGYYSDWIQKETNIVPKSIDISKTAIENAKRLFPELDFEVANVCTDLKKYKDLDCVILSEIMWYILPDLSLIFENLKTYFKDKFLIINQVFYRDTQTYGNNYFTNLKEMIAYVPLTLMGQCESTTYENDTIQTFSLFKIT